MSYKSELSIDNIVQHYVGIPQYQLLYYSDPILKTKSLINKNEVKIFNKKIGYDEYIF